MLGWSLNHDKENMFYEPCPSYYIIGSILYLIYIYFLLNIYLILVDQLNMGYILVIIWYIVFLFNFYLICTENLFNIN